jgi:hypothetical protein
MNTTASPDDRAALTDFQTFAINRAISVFEDVMGDILNWEDDFLSVAVAGAITDLRSALSPSQPQPVNRGVPNKLSVREKASNSNNLVWPEGYCLDPNGKMSCPDGAYPHWSFGYDMGYAEALALRTNVIKDALAQIRSASVPVNRVDGESPSDLRAQIQRIADDYQPHSASQAILALEEMRQALRELLADEAGLASEDHADTMTGNSRADGDAVPVHDHPSTEAGDYLPIDFGDAVPVAWVKPFALESLKQQDKVGTKLYRMRHKNAHATVPLYAAPVASTSADAQPPIAWRARGYAQFKTGMPSEWRYYDGATKPTLNKPECCDIEPLGVLAAPIASALPANLVRFVDTTDLFKEALAWGKVYGPHISAEQWGEMRDTHALEFAQRVVDASALPAAPIVTDQALTMDVDELAEFERTVAEFEDASETSTDYDQLMDWARRGLLECTHFEVTKSGNDILAAAPIALALPAQDKEPM